MDPPGYLGMGPFELAILGLGAAFALWLISRARAKGQTLVIRRFDVNRYPAGEQVPVVMIVGRRAGILSFLFMLLGLDPQTIFRVTQSEIECRLTSLAGRVSIVVPLSRVASVTAGVWRPIGYVILAGLVFVAGVVSGAALQRGALAAVGVVLAGAFILAYFLSKCVLVQVSSNAGLEIVLRIKPSVLEGVPIDERKAITAVGTIRDLITASQSLVGHDASPPPLPAGGQQFPQPQQPHVGGPGTAPAPVGAAPPVSSPAGSQVGPESVNGRGDFAGAAREALVYAINVYNSGRTSEGVRLLADVAKQYPTTAAAATARQHLRRIRQAQSGRGGTGG